jgi:HD-like signal output (HDOD) protein
MSVISKEYNEIVDSLAGELPSIPLIMNDLLKIISDSNTALFAVQNIIKNDKSIYSNILKIANKFESRQGSTEKITSISDAIQRVGFEDVKKICINTSVFNLFDGFKSESDFQIEDFWKHSCGVAVASETLAERYESKYSKHAYSCGLLHDLGKVAKIKFSAKNFFRSLRHAKRYNCSIIDSEGTLNVVKHDILGACVVKKWGISSIVENTTRWHHTTNKDLRLEIEDPNLNKLIDIIILANHIIKDLEFGNSGYKIKQQLPPEFLRRRKMDDQGLQNCKKVVQEALEAEAEHLAIFSKK